MQDEFYASREVAVASPSVRVGGRGCKPAYKFDYRVGLGLEYLAWADTDKGKASAKCSLKAFSETKWLLKDVPKKTRAFVRRCAIAAEEFKSGDKIWKTTGVRQSGQGVARPQRLRKGGNAGRPVKAMCLREGIWDWFVSIRSAVATRIPPKLVLVKAQALASELIKEMERTGVWIDLPKLDKHWLRRWKQHYGVSLRKPNRRYKCSKAVLLARLRAMWVTTVRIRALAKYTLKRDLICEGYDQKGLHMNEGGSKNTGSLDIKGAPEVRLKENHAATRQRLSLMTGVTSSFEEASRLGGPPLEVCFKGMTDKVLRGLELRRDMQISLAFGPKGSYRAEHVVRFLERWLRPWTEEREASADYRLLYLDAFAAHLDQSVVDIAWSKGYFTVYHGGCTTGVSQVNDTDLHAALEREYVACEAISFYEQQSIDPGNISRTRQQVRFAPPTLVCSINRSDGYVRTCLRAYAWICTCAYNRVRAA